MTSPRATLGNHTTYRKYDSTTVRPRMSRRIRQLQAVSAVAEAYFTWQHRIPGCSRGRSRIERSRFEGWSAQRLRIDCAYARYEAAVGSASEVR
eukprot:1008818-Prymnesium_polylepis.1